jgi:hypothetical protein
MRNSLAAAGGLFRELAAAYRRLLAAVRARGFPRAYAREAILNQDR